VHPCAVYPLYPVILKPMDVSIYKISGTLQYFDEARNAYEMAHTVPGFCGDRTLTVSDPLCKVLEPYPTTDPDTNEKWAISAVANDKSDVGDYNLVVTAQLVNYPEV
jgi:hypothetical protein